MRKMTKILSLLFSLTLILTLVGGVSGEAWADAAPDGSASVGWAVSIKDEEGNELPAEDVEAILSEGFALDWGKDDGGTPITAPTVADLRRGGVKITPPAGYTVASLLIVADGSEPSPESKSLALISQADLGGKSGLILPKEIFAEDFNAAAVGSVFNGSGSAYTLRIALDRISSGQISLRYTAGALSDALASADLIAGSNPAVYTLSDEQYSASVQIALIGSDAAEYALTQLGKQFAGWKLTLANGAQATLAGGENFTLSSDATLDAQWKDVIVFSFSSGEKLYDGTPLTVDYTVSGAVKDGDSLNVPDSALTLQRTDAGESTATVDLSGVSVMRGDEDVSGEYDFLVRPGTLRVVERGVSFAVKSISAEYSGSALRPTEYELSEGSLAEGHSESVTFSGEQTVPGESTAAAVVKISDAEGRDVSENYNISVINGTVTVLPRSEKIALGVTLNDSEKTYDGEALSQTTYSLTDGSLLGSDQLSVVSFEGSITDAGTETISASFAVTIRRSTFRSASAPTEMTGRPRKVSRVGSVSAKAAIRAGSSASRTSSPAPQPVP